MGICRVGNGREDNWDFFFPSDLIKSFFYQKIGTQHVGSGPRVKIRTLKYHICKQIYTMVTMRLTGLSGMYPITIEKNNHTRTGIFLHQHILGTLCGYIYRSQSIYVLPSKTFCMPRLFFFFFECRVFVLLVDGQGVKDHNHDLVGSQSACVQCL